MFHHKKILGNDGSQIGTKKPLDYNKKLRKVEKLTDEGEYRGKLISFKETDTTIIVKVALSDLNEAVNYASVNAFLRKEYADDLTMETFLETFGQPDDWRDLIGQECLVYVERNENSSGTLFYNVVEFGKIE